MNNVILIRDETGPQGTFGRLKVMETGFTCYTAELPWLDNARGKSCIPEGTYGATYMARSASGKFKEVYHLHEVEGRSGILLHAGNYAGDKDKGFEAHSDGCILIGQLRGVLDGQQAVLASRAALRALVKQLGREPARFYIWDRSNA